MAYDLVEERLLNGTATSQETVHFLRLGSTKERIEKEILERQKDLITAKTEAMQAAKKTEELYAKVIDALKQYGGDESEDDE